VQHRPRRQPLHAHGADRRPSHGRGVRSFEEPAGGEDEILPALSSLAVEIREALGESLEAIQLANRPLPEVTTASLHALQLYARGSTSGSGGITRRQSSSTSPHSRRTGVRHGVRRARQRLHEPHLQRVAQGPECFDKALKLAARTTDRERLLLESAAAGAVGNVVESERLLRVYLARYPDDVGVRYSLGRC